MKNIPGYEDYAVDDQGNVFSLNYHRTGKTRKLKPVNNRKDHLRVGLSKNGKQKWFYVHRLVAQAYLKNYSEDLQVDHIDRNPLNNKVENLRMVTNQQNTFNTNAAGCHWSKQKRKWFSQIGWNDKKIYLGLFDSEEEAYHHYLDAKEAILEMI